MILFTLSLCFSVTKSGVGGSESSAVLTNLYCSSSSSSCLLSILEILETISSDNYDN